MKPNVATMELFIFKKHDDSVLIALKGGPEDGGAHL